MADERTQKGRMAGHFEGREDCSWISTINNMTSFCAGMVLGGFKTTQHILG